MNHYYTALFQYVGQILDLPPADKRLIQQLFEPVFVPKNTILEAAGQVPHYHNFIVSGYMRNYYLDQNNQEVTTDLNDGPRFFTSYFHFMNQTISNENLQCLTDCELLRTSRRNVEIGGQTSTTQKDYTIQILQQHLQQDKRRIDQLSNLTAEERYQNFIQEKPTLLQHVPLRHIASYLGITQRHLSRLRHQFGS
ncbi:Crp/Fnr family transcriptional regulator [Spirosoma agri]|uniref:Crp/Fnr family transcriptional regulator n=1 Tax=Spirosoma agri TaxID=1987381 RepID=A0A6M0ISA4_9BACT|nr:Crp/Fnr family transcriptional regulator [Spirosoma agri]NEU70902.1 Crp/Fnr family transcriptional regulator [Spirosoma agri]